MATSSSISNAFRDVGANRAGGSAALLKSALPVRPRGVNHAKENGFADVAATRSILRRGDAHAAHITAMPIDQSTWPCLKGGASASDDQKKEPSSQCVR
jgi:hypothetical protein